VSKALDALAEWIGHDQRCGLLTEEDDDLSRCTCGARAVLLEVRAEFVELERVNGVLRRCWEKAEADRGAAVRWLVFAIMLLVFGVAMAVGAKCGP
jgi:hypothetical protein